MTLFHGLKELMDSAVEIFKVKRDWMKRLIDSGRIPFATMQLVDPNDPSKKAPPAIDLDS
jgi:ribonucleoside-triphosphate reductase